MTEHSIPPANTPVAASPVVKERRSISIVWLVPLIAVVIGGWLAYKAVTEKGPVITISFQSAEGLEAGKTKVKYKDVEVGVVQDIEIDQNLSHVLVKVEMHKNARPYLTEKTRFWVVRARIAAGQVSGLGTLLGGAYIGVEPSTEGTFTEHYIGLEKPPIVTNAIEGRRFILKASRLGSLSPGSPIYFRQIQVGQVVDFKLDNEGKSVGVDIFIDSPYDHFVRQNSRFWVASGLDLQLSANGLRVDTESLVSLMIGGIAFTTFTEEKPTPEAEENSHFKLYETLDQARDDRYTARTEFYIEFADSVRGLSVGAPVEFRGFQIGSVNDLTLKSDFEKLEFSTMVRISIERQRLSLPDEIDEDPTDRFLRMVDGGLRAQLKTGSLLTGQLFVDLEFSQDAAAAAPIRYNNLLVLPSVPSTTQELMADLSGFMKKLNQLPLEKIGRNLQSSMAGIDQLVNSAEMKKSLHSLERLLKEGETMAKAWNGETLPAVNANLAEIQTLLRNLEGWVSADAPLYGDLRNSLEELSKAARSINELADMLERHPEALIQGKRREAK